MQAATNYTKFINSLCQPIDNLIGVEATANDIPATYKNKSDKKFNPEDLYFSRRTCRRAESRIDAVMEFIKTDSIWLNISYPVGTPLCYSINEGFIEYAKKLIGAGSDLNVGSFKILKPYIFGERPHEGTFVTAFYTALDKLPNNYVNSQNANNFIQLLILKGAKIGMQIGGKMRELISVAVEGLNKEMYEKLHLLNSQTNSDRPYLNRDAITNIFDQYILVKVAELSKPIGDGYDAYRLECRDDFQ